MLLAPDVELFAYGLWFVTGCIAYAYLLYVFVGFVDVVFLFSLLLRYFDASLTWYCFCVGFNFGCSITLLFGFAGAGLFYLRVVYVISVLGLDLLWFCCDFYLFCCFVRFVLGLCLLICFTLLV